MDLQKEQYGTPEKLLVDQLSKFKFEGRSVRKTPDKPSVSDENTDRNINISKFSPRQEIKLEGEQNNDRNKILRLSNKSETSYFTPRSKECTITKTPETKSNRKSKSSNKFTPDQLKVSQFQTPDEKKEATPIRESQKPNSIRKEIPNFDCRVEYDPDIFLNNEIGIQLPEWAQQPFLKDRQGRFPGSEGYDPTCLYIPPGALDKMGKIMKQYWETKADNFDKLIFVKLWKMFYVYHDDALLVQKLCDLRLNNWKNSNVVYFHQNSLHDNITVLLENNQKVILIEPTERSIHKDSVKREICQIITRGTYIEPNLEDYDSRYCLFIIEGLRCFGIIYLDSTTHEFYFGEFFDSQNRNDLKTLILKIKPVEIVYRRNNLSAETLNIIKDLDWKPQITLFPKDTIPPPEEIVWKIKRAFKSKEGQSTEDIRIPQLIYEMKETFDDYYNKNKDLEDYIEKETPFYYTFQALFLSLEYLQYLLLADSVFALSNFYPLDIMEQKTESMYLDIASIHNLQVIQTSSEDYSLLKFMDKTRTSMGKRTFKKWVLYPLKDPQKITERLDIVEELLNHIEVTEYFRSELGKVPDIERMINIVYNYTNKRVLSPIDMEYQAKNKLKYFIELLEILEEIAGMINNFSKCTVKFQHPRIKQLISFKPSAKRSDKKQNTNPVEGIFPRISDYLSEFKKRAVIIDGLPVPSPGVSEDYDNLANEMEILKLKFNSELISIKAALKCPEAKFVNTKHKYEIEVPQQILDKIMEFQYTVTSKRRDHIRFHTPTIEKLLKEMNNLEQETHRVMVPFVINYFKLFYEKNSFWMQMVSCLSELDCLCGLAKLAHSMKMKTKPIVVNPQDTLGKQVFDIKGMVHPTAAKDNKLFIPNDITIEDNGNIFLITGPNMGGKSTLMRAACITTLMAQVGSYVPAEYFRFTPVDRIFTRIGSSDCLAKNKSTFYLELEESLIILKEASRQSLIVIDELGRGTSTYDGIALAYSVLKYISSEIQCLTFFATHYHILIEEFRLYQNIVDYHMSCQFRDDTILKFLYKFTKGEMTQSFGIHTARVSGLDEEIVKKASSKSKFLTKEQQNINQEKEITVAFNKCVNKLLQITSNPWLDTDKELKQIELSLNHLMGVQDQQQRGKYRDIKEKQEIEQENRAKFEYQQAHFL